MSYCNITTITNNSLQFEQNNYFNNGFLQRKNKDLGAKNAAVNCRPYVYMPWIAINSYTVNKPLVG